MHFENIWTQSEEVAEALMNKNSGDRPFAIDDIISRLILLKEFDQMPQAERERQMGNILFMLSYLSKSWDINTWKALKESMEGYNIDYLDPDIESEL